jgi:hypothetical protein
MQHFHTIIGTSKTAISPARTNLIKTVSGKL